MTPKLLLIRLRLILPALAAFCVIPEAHVQGATATGTTKYSITNAGWTDLGAGPMLLSFRGTGVYAIGDTPPSMVAEGFQLAAGDSVSLNTTSHVWAMAPSVVAYVAPLSTGDASGGSGGVVCSNLGDGCHDVSSFTGSITSGVLTATSVSGAAVASGQLLNDGGVNIPANTYIVSPAVDGGWRLSNATLTVASEAMAGTAIAPVTANSAAVKIPNFWTYASSTTGKSFDATSLAQVNFNPPGVGYLVGASAEPVKDASTPPINCSWNAGSRQLTCGDGGSGAGVTIDGYNFCIGGGSGGGSGNNVFLTISVSNTGPKIISNNKFCGPTASGYYGMQDSSPGLLILRNNWIDPGGPLNTSNAFNSAVLTNTTTYLIAEYNYFHNAQRFINVAAGTVYKFNYGECTGTGWATSTSSTLVGNSLTVGGTVVGTFKTGTGVWWPALLGNFGVAISSGANPYTLSSTPGDQTNIPISWLDLTNHAEPILGGVPVGHTPYWENSYNTFLWPASCPAGATATITPSESGGAANILDNLIVDHNIGIANFPGGSSATQVGIGDAHAGVQLDHSAFVNTTVTNNFIYPLGSGDCNYASPTVSTPSGAVVFSGNVNLYDHTDTGVNGWDGNSGTKCKGSTNNP